MGLADEFFWNLTPRLFEMLVKQRGQCERRKDLRAGFLAAQFHNANRTKRSDKVWTVADFFPEEAESGKEVQTEDQMLMAMNAWVARTKGRKESRN